MGDCRRGVDKTRSKQARDRLPRGEDLAPRDTIEPQLLEDDIVRHVDRHRTVRKAQHRHAPCGRQCLESLAKCCLAAGHLEDDIHTDPPCSFENPGNYIVPGRIEEHVRPHLARKTQPVVREIANKQLSCPKGFCDADCKDADGPGACHQHCLAGNRLRVDGIKGISHGLLNRCPCSRNRVVVPPQHPLRNGHILSKGTGPVDAQDLQVLADLAVSRTALIAMSAVDVRL